MHEQTTKGLGKINICITRFGIRIEGRKYLNEYAPFESVSLWTYATWELIYILRILSIRTLVPKGICVGLQVYDATVYTANTSTIIWSPVTGWREYKFLKEIIFSVVNIMHFFHLRRTLLIYMCLQNCNVMCETFIYGQLFQPSDIAFINGSLYGETNVKNLVECSLACLRRKDCSEFLFSELQHHTVQCRTIKPGRALIDMRVMPAEFKYYASSTQDAVQNPTDRLVGCSGIYLGDTRAGLPLRVGQISGCPTFNFFYFSLDNVNGLYR